MAGEHIKHSLVFPSNSPRIEAFVNQAKASGRKVLLLYKADSAAISETAASDSLMWNPLSFASSRATVLEAQARFGKAYNELVIVADPPSDMVKLTDLSIKDIENTALEWAAGYAELLRETIRHFEENKGGSIVLVLVQAERGPLGSMAAGALLGLAQGMLLTGSPMIKFSIVKDESLQYDMLANHIIKILDSESKAVGKIQSFGNRLSLFSR